MEENACRAADLYLAGHDHNLQVLEPPRGSPCRSLFIVSGAGGYATYGFPGGNPSLFQAQTFGFAYVTIEAARLSVEVFDADGQCLYGKELAKKR
jgi:tartrate-resistant acid phosphatase type 5